ncbi:MAG TPA: hypothetical protein VEL03_17425 [Streptosporangiaceae bacterium]|nr:hypothetical protein [Streptosporangiaceae bacterium]
MRSTYLRVSDLEAALRCVAELSAKTIVFDVEPLIALWDTGQQSLDDGLAVTLEQVAGIPGVEVVCFATNSVRRPSAALASAGARLIYVASAGKPLRVAQYRGFPRPGAVVGDQVATDGILARRLGYAFVHFRPEPGTTPVGPRLLDLSGRLLEPFLFTRRAVG